MDYPQYLHSSDGEINMQAPKPNRNLSLFIGLWLGLTVAAGLGTFGVLYWAANNSGSASSVEPTAVSVISTDAPTPLPIPTTDGQPVNPVPSPVCEWLPVPASNFAYGIQVHALIPGVDSKPYMDMARYKLNLNWVKLQVRWQDIEKQSGQVDWNFLDNALEAACGNGLRVMLSVVAAPEWARANALPGSEAPPDDYNTLANFIISILQRHPGKVSAVEVWNEANLEREWNTPGGVNAGEFAQLVRVTSQAIKAVDPNIVIISGAPSPTGINCNGSWPTCAGGRPAVVDDATYLKQFIAAGGLNGTDCVGIHANGTNLPPDADAYNPPPDTGYNFKGPWTTPHYSWSLRSQVEKYVQVMQEAGNVKPLCMTEFGYASPSDGKFPPGYDYALDVDEKKQAEYLVAAINWMRDSGKVQMAFIFNLDYGPKGGDPVEDDNVIFSLLSKQGIPRPAFDAIAVMPKP